MWNVYYELLCTNVHHPIDSLLFFVKYIYIYMFYINDSSIQIIFHMFSFSL